LGEGAFFSFPKESAMTATTALTSLRLLADVPITLRWRDLDAFNHVNNSTFLTFLEEARIVWLSRLFENWDRGEVTPIMAATQLNYRRQLNWPGRIVVELYCERLGNTSLTIAHRIVDAGDASIVYLDGNVVMVWIDPASGRPVPLPQVIRNACA
jgi:acyl-CoA thioester hydrolase